MPHTTHHASLHDGYQITDDPALMDAGVWHEYLMRSYWAANMPRDLLDKSIANSLCVGIYDPSGQRIEPTGAPTGATDARPASPPRPPMVGAGRVITDRSTYAYLSDVFVLEEHRGRGLSKALMATILSHPDLQGLRRFALFTRDAHTLYAQFGFAACPHPDRYMERKGAPYAPAPPASP